ncbi:hypothetical protein ACFSPU_10335 [Haoranjiania flava]|uniref:Uncharacterized protein n=1 Tax=Haoranjiania flava TaxID=1856322 RepID=A0AAE3IP04_9BACT|nr:hypothetical protein [Haoranjiania flava]MCU7695194.1 hypothetical protein [Haoranjiania flava]
MHSNSSPKNSRGNSIFRKALLSIAIIFLISYIGYSYLHPNEIDTTAFIFQATSIILIIAALLLSKNRKQAKAEKIIIALVLTAVLLFTFLKFLK